MKTLNLVKTLMRIDDSLAVFDESVVGKCLNYLQLSLVLIGPISIIQGSIGFSIAHLDDMQLVISAMYTIIGCAISASLHISLWYQSDKLLRLLNRFESVVNERSIGSSGGVYYQTEFYIQRFGRNFGLCWCSMIFFMISGCFMGALYDYFTGDYTISSLKLLQPKVVYPWDMTNERNFVLTILSQCYGCPWILCLILVPQYLFMAISRYFASLIEDAKDMIQRFDCRSHVKLMKNIEEMMNLHATSLDLIKDYGRIMSGPIFIINTFSMTCLCTNLFELKRISTRHSYAEMQVTITATLFIFQMLFAFCYLGNQLTTKAFEINESIYSFEWYNCPIKVQMYLILIMKRSQKPFIMTGYSLVSCSLRSFKDMLHFVGSAFLLLLKLDE